MNLKKTKRCKAFLLYVVLILVPLSVLAESAQDAFLEGTRLGKSGQYDEAVNAYSRAIKLNPRHVEAYTYRGLTNVQLGRTNSAINDLSKVVQLDPSADSYQTRADVYARNGQLENAIEDYDKSLQLDPDNASGYRNRGTAYSEKGDYKRAATDFTKAISLEPNNAQYYFDRAMLKARRGEYDSAMTDAKECLRFSGGLPDLRPGERKEVNEVNFQCIRLYGDLKEVGATP